MDTIPIENEYNSHNSHSISSVQSVMPQVQRLWMTRWREREKSVSTKHEASTLFTHYFQLGGRMDLVL